MTFPLVLLNKAAAAAVVVSLMMMVPDSRRSSISGAHAFAITQQQFQHQQTAHAATTPTPHTGGGSATSTTSTTTIVSTTRLRSTVFSEAEMLALISDPAYAVDIRSTSGTGSIDKETLFGQTSGVSDDDDNDGTAVSAQRRSSAIATWFQNAVGRIFTWKNKPIYEKLWTIIEDDCLALIQQKIPELQPRRTWFDSAGPDDGNDDVVAKATTASAATPHSFVSADGTCQGTVAAYRGGRVDWLTTCRFFSKALGFGIMRIDGWTTRCDTRAPHMAVHLCIIMNVMFIYITLVPRSNLVLDDEYNDYVYNAPKAALGNKSLNDLHAQCVDDKAFKQYISKSHVVNAFMVAPTTLLYTVPYQEKHFQKVRDLSRGYVATWLDMLAEQDGPFVKGIDTKEIQAELLRLDVRSRQFCVRDPDTKNVVNLFGLETTEKLCRTFWGDTEDIIWQTR